MTTTKTTSKPPRRMARPVEPGGLANPVAEAVKLPTKTSLVLDLLQREGGASLAAIVEATGWLPHTARAALTGLRKKGHAIVRSKVEDETRYSIAPAAAE